MFWYFLAFLSRAAGLFVVGFFIARFLRTSDPMTLVAALGGIIWYTAGTIATHQLKESARRKR